MSVFDYFKPVSAWTVDEFKKFMDHSTAGKLQMIDVRQPDEYEHEYLPGAELIPLSDLPSRIGELDPAKPTLAY